MAIFYFFQSATGNLFTFDKYLRNIRVVYRMSVLLRYINEKIKIQTRIRYPIILIYI